MIMAVVRRQLAERYEILRVQFLRTVDVHRHDVMNLRLLSRAARFANRMIGKPRVSSCGPLGRSYRLGLFLLPVEERKHGNPFRLGVNY